MMRRLSSYFRLIYSFLTQKHSHDASIGTRTPLSASVTGHRPEDEAVARKQRSIDRLVTEGVPVLASLPFIETEAEAQFRTAEQVALRAMTLCIVASRAEGLDEALTRKLVADFKLDESLTPKEKKFLFDAQPSNLDRTQFVWRYESYWVLLWACGFVDELATPTKTCDVKKAIEILRSQGRDTFLKAAILRPKSEILDEADLIYRYHWAVRDAQFDHLHATGRLHPDVVMERHHALNWLIGYSEQDWDDVTTDT